MYKCYIIFSCSMWPQELLIALESPKKSCTTYIFTRGASKELFRTDFARKTTGNKVFLRILVVSTL